MRGFLAKYLFSAEKKNVQAFIDFSVGRKPGGRL